MGNRRLKEICEDIWIFVLRIRVKCLYFWVRNQGNILLFFVNLLLAILRLSAWAALVWGLMLILGHFCEVDIHINRSRITLHYQCPEPVIKPDPPVAYILSRVSRF
ncbi:MULTISPECIES: hypothetical protein [unclassified Microcoleus]|uniref:hypothetical protein n=1 Tax=unclassified Microcoleus TaxID=2642155 RepID=UPI002FD3954C